MELNPCTAILNLTGTAVIHINPLTGHQTYWPRSREPAFLTYSGSPAQQEQSHRYGLLITTPPLITGVAGMPESGDVIVTLDVAMWVKDNLPWTGLLLVAVPSDRHEDGDEFGQLCCARFLNYSMRE